MIATNSAPATVAPHATDPGHTASGPTVAAGDIDMIEPFEACRRLGIAPGRLLVMIDTGQIAAFDFGGAIRLRATDVAHWYAQSRTAA